MQYIRPLTKFFVVLFIALLIFLFMYWITSLEGPLYFSELSLTIKILAGLLVLMGVASPFLSAYGFRSTPALVRLIYGVGFFMLSMFLSGTIIGNYIEAKSTAPHKPKYSIYKQYNPFETFETLSENDRNVRGKGIVFADDDLLFYASRNIFGKECFARTPLDVDYVIYFKYDKEVVGHYGPAFAGNAYKITGTFAVMDWRRKKVVYKSPSFTGGSPSTSGCGTRTGSAPSDEMEYAAKLLLRPEWCK